ncbi:MAG: SBBP repeat-containing protein [Candidatus Moraniibacteriota bacterium]|nr:MAG: SBBP repeat-containing protein [Candidatus Moranbacteria bacterium]
MRIFSYKKSHLLPTLFGIFFVFFFLSQYAQAATVTHEWSKRLGGAGSDTGYYIAIGSSGNMYVAEYITGDADLNGDGDFTDPYESGIGFGGTDAFFSVFSSDGTYLWSKRLGGTGTDNGSSITLDSSGNLYVAGSVTGIADLNGDGDILDVNETGGVPYGGQDAFISAFTSSGEYLWSKRLGGVEQDTGRGSSVDFSGGIYISGQTRGTADFNGDGDTNDFNETVVAPYGEPDAFLSAFTSDGTHLWSKRLGGLETDTNYKVITDFFGNLYVTGFITGDADLNGDGDILDVNETGGVPYGGQDAFISAFTSSGEYLWSKRLGGGSFDYIWNISSRDTSRNIYIAGSVTGIADLNGDGDILDVNETGGVPYGGQDAFISAFTSSGEYLWSRRLGGVGNDFVYSSISNSSGNIYITGRITDIADLNGDGDFTDPYESGVGFGGSDIFLSAFSYDTTPPSLSLTPISTPTPDSTPTLTGTATDLLSTIQSVEFQLNSTSGSWTPCTPDDGTFNSASESFSCTTPELTDGTYTIYTRSTDSNTNTTKEGEESSFTFTIDLTYPSLTLNPLPPLTNDSTLILTGTTKDTDGTIQNVEYQLDSLSGSWTPCTSNDSLFEEQEESFTCTLTNLSDGNHIIYIRSTDNVGNSTSIQTSPSEDTTIDTKEPTLEPKSQITLELKGTKKTNIEEGETFYTQKERPKLKGRNEEAKNGTVVVYQRTYLGAKRKIATARIDKDGNWEYSLPKKENDSRHYAIKLIDEAGNESDISQWFKVIYDRKAPTFKTELPKTQNVTRGTRIDFPAKDNFSGIDSYQVKLTPYHKEWKKIPNKKDSFFIIPESVSNGIYTLTLKVTDKAGNRLTHSMTVTVGD